MNDDARKVLSRGQWKTLNCPLIAADSRQEGVVWLDDDSLVPVLQRFDHALAAGLIKESPFVERKQSPEDTSAQCIGAIYYCSSSGRALSQILSSLSCVLSVEAGFDIARK